MQSLLFLVLLSNVCLGGAQLLSIRQIALLLSVLLKLSKMEEDLKKLMCKLVLLQTLIVQSPPQILHKLTHPQLAKTSPPASRLGETKWPLETAAILSTPRMELSWIPACLAWPARQSKIPTPQSVWGPILGQSASMIINAIPVSSALLWMELVKVSQSWEGPAIQPKNVDLAHGARIKHALLLDLLKLERSSMWLFKNLSILEIYFSINRTLAHITFQAFSFVSPFGHILWIKLCIQMQLEIIFVLGDQSQHLVAMKLKMEQTALTTSSPTSVLSTSLWTNHTASLPHAATISNKPLYAPCLEATALDSAISSRPHFETGSTRFSGQMTWPKTAASLPQFSTAIPLKTTF